MYTLFIGLLAGSVSAWVIGNSTSWWRVILATLIGLAAGVVADVGLPYISHMPSDLLRVWVTHPLIGHYGLTQAAITGIPLGLLGAALAALRNYNWPFAHTDLGR